MKSSSARVNAFAFYIMQSVMDIFDKGMASNFVFILTFADASLPIVL